MGGEEFGAEASLLAARALAGVPAEEFARSSGRLLEQVNGAICALMRQKQARIGTTFAGLWVCGGRAGAVNLGDSRVYRLRASALERLSRDHTHVQRLLDMGLTKGVTIRVIKAAPLGDPIEISVRGYELSLRKRESACIQIAR